MRGEKKMSPPHEAASSSYPDRRSLEVADAERDGQEPRAGTIRRHGDVATFEEHVLATDVEVQTGAEVEAELIAPRHVGVLIAIAANREVARVTRRRRKRESLIPVVVPTGDRIQIPTAEVQRTDLQVSGKVQHKRRPRADVRRGVAAIQQRLFTTELAHRQIGAKRTHALPTPTPTARISVG